MLTRSLVVGVPLLLSLFIAGCDTNGSSSSNQATAIDTITIEHAQGATVVPLNPKKVIVFNTATLDTMDALGIEITGVPQTSVHLPKFLAKYQGPEYMNAGTLFEPNYEALSNLQPDLIIAGGRMTDTYDKLSEVAPTISLAVDNTDFVNSLANSTVQLGQIFGKEAEAKIKIEQFKQKIQEVKSKVPANDTAMFIMINGGRMSAFGSGSRFGFIFDELGFNPLSVTQATAGTHGNVLSAELLLSMDPDWLFVLDRDSAIGNNEALSAQQVLDNPLIHKTKAWQNGKIVYLDSSSIYIAGGLQTYDQLLDQINQVLTQE